MIITDYEILRHGVEHSQYFQGCGVSFTRFSEVSTGIGYTEREALLVAIETARQALPDGIEFPEDDVLFGLPALGRESTVEPLHPLPGHGNLDVPTCKATNCEHAVGGDIGDCAECEDCDLHWYVSVRFNLPSPIPATQDRLDRIFGPSEAKEKHQKALRKGETHERTSSV